MTNIGHFRAAAKLLAAVDAIPTRLWISPPTKMDEHQLREEGVYNVFARAGARTEMPGCSLCMGNQARVAANSTVVSTSTRNFPNRLGDGADVYLASGYCSSPGPSADGRPVSAIHGRTEHAGRRDLPLSQFPRNQFVPGCCWPRFDPGRQHPGGGALAVSGQPAARPQDGAQTGPQIIPSAPWVTPPGPSPQSRARLPREQILAGLPGLLRLLHNSPAHTHSPQRWHLLQGSGRRSATRAAKLLGPSPRLRASPARASSAQ